MKEVPYLLKMELAPQVGATSTVRGWGGSSGHAHHHGFFFRFMPKTFQFSHGCLLIVSGKEHGVIEIQAKRAVACRCVIGAVRKMDVAADIS